MRNFIKNNSDRVEKFISRAEIAGLVLTLIAVLLIVKKLPLSSECLTVGLSILAFVYAFLGNFSKEVYSLKKTDLLSIALTASYIALSITTLGILFLVQLWKGGTMMIQWGSIATGVLFVYFLYKLYFGKAEEDSHRNIINNLIVRMLPALLVVGFLISIYFRR